MELYWIWFSLLKLSDRQKRRILETVSGPQELFHTQWEPGQFPEEVNNKDLTKAQKILEKCRKKEIQVLGFGEKSYPARLRVVEDAPMVLYCDGKLPSWEDVPMIGVVGTRELSGYGEKNAYRLGKQIASCGAVVVSGGAKGADALAMAGAMAASGPVVGVVGTGVDIYYPKSNEDLLKKTREKGCLISEYPPGTRAAPWQFPRRNRIISGISHGVVVVEAPESSGALITAAMAREQGRDVYAVPGNVGSPTCVGSNRLLQQGATAAMCGWDVMRDYESLFPCVGKAPGSTDLSLEETPLFVAQTPKTPVPQERKNKQIYKKFIDNEENSSYSVCVDLPELSEEERYVLSRLSNEIRPMDELILELDMPSGKALTILTKLTLIGVAKGHPGKGISLK